MVDPCKCKYCGTITARPIMFSPTRQRVFNYIWDNPKCSAKDIIEAIYGRMNARSSVLVHISRIRIDLLSTHYCLIAAPAGYRNLEREYSIIQYKDQPAGSSHVSP